MVVLFCLIVANMYRLLSVHISCVREKEPVSECVRVCWCAIVCVRAYMYIRVHVSVTQQVVYLSQIYHIHIIHLLARALSHKTYEAQERSTAATP